MKAFVRYCPAVTITGDYDKADYMVRFDMTRLNPTTPFVHGHNVAVFHKNEDLVHKYSTRILKNAVKDSCTAISSARSGTDRQER
jgi:hypothetical protein